MSNKVEPIPDNDKLYHRVHKNNIVDGEIIPGAFREIGEGEQKSMSHDWSKYSTPSQSQNRARVPAANSIISFIAGELRALELKVAHSPSHGNISHTDVKGRDLPIEEDEEIRLKLLKLYNTEIKYGNN